jgi:predicted enzyme related to lactoylglutathione lyase
MSSNGRPGTVYWIDHYTVCTNDLDRFSAFHAQVLGGQQYPTPAGNGVFQDVARSKTGAFLLKRALPPTRGLGTGLPRYGFYIEAAEIDKHLARLEAAGAVHSAPQRTAAHGDAGTAIYWQDPDGNQFEFWAPDVLPAGAMSDCGAERVGRISHGVFESRDLERTAAFFAQYCGVERLPSADVAADSLVLRLAAGARLIFCKVDTLEGRTTGFGMPDPHTALIVRCDDFFPNYRRLWTDLPEWDFDFWGSTGEPVANPETFPARTFLHSSPAGRRFKALAGRGDGFLDPDTNFFHFFGGTPIRGDSMAIYEGRAVDFFIDEWEREHGTLETLRSVVPA